MSIIDQIARNQPPLSQRNGTPPSHKPKMLLIGCIDARLDPVKDLGIAQGEALILRNIAASVPPYKAPDASVAPEASSVAAAVEFFIHNFPAPEEDGIKHIAVAGHTDCGGLKACCGGGIGAPYEHLPNYIHGLDDVRAAVMKKAAGQGWDQEELLHQIERESVRRSVENLMGYPAVAQAVAEGKLQLHGWVLDTGSKRIHMMDLESQEFKPMPPQAALDAAILGRR